MNRYIQLHILTSYPPANLNRDDLGRPKTAIMGGKTRLRISSQCLKRTWRTSDIFQEAMSGYIGTRTKEMGCRLYDRLIENGVSENKGLEWIKKIAGQFGKLKKGTEENPLQGLEIEQLAFFSPSEISEAEKLVDKLAAEDRAPEESELELLRKETNAIDVGMFGRMLASSPVYNIEAAVQVAHAITVHEVAVEDDFFIAVDDLNTGEEDLGAGHMGDIEFGAGLFYEYICINRELLINNLNDDIELASRGISALVESAVKVAPTGKQNSFASRAYASFILAEKGDQQPRSLAVSFLKPVRGNDILTTSISALLDMHNRMDQAYGSCSESSIIMNVKTGEGSLEKVLKFVEE